VVPADVDPDIEQRVRDLALAAFEALDCAGLARVDVFVREGEILINELNTMPGFTYISMFPRMWSASGVGYVDLVNRLVADALRRGTGLA
jgi:D-alanine-D-alanine ligase